MKPIVLVRFGEPIVPTRLAVGDYSLWFQRALPDEPLGLVDLRDPEQELPPAAGYIVMGSPLAIYDPHPWLERGLAAGRQMLAGEVPALGVCFGHQLFAVAAGGEVAKNTQVEVGTVEVRLEPQAAGDPLFGRFGGSLSVNASHDDTVTRLPAERTPAVLGRSDRDAHQVLRWGEQVWSVQFHPEMRARETRLAVTWRSPRLRDEGEDPEAIPVDDAPDGVRLLRAFADLVRGRPA